MNPKTPTTRRKAAKRRPRKLTEEELRLQQQAVKLGVYFERERCARVADTIGRATSDAASYATALFISTMIRGTTEEQRVRARKLALKIFDYHNRSEADLATETEWIVQHATQEAQRANERAEGLLAILKKAVEVTGAPYPAGETSTGQVAQWCRVCGRHSGRHLSDCWIPAAREAVR